MAAQQQNDRQPSPQPQPRYTTPLLPDLPHPRQLQRIRELAEATRLTVWEPCARCHESGVIEQGRPHCTAHRRTFRAEDIRDWRGRLPCGHRLDDATTVYVNAACPDCGGAGGHDGYVTLADVLDYIEAVYASITSMTTARQRAM